MKREMEYILEIARTGNVSKAAENLFIGQPALSKAIVSVENEMGMKLFSRDQKGVTLTRAGELYVEYALKIQEYDRELKLRLSNEQASNRHVLNVAMTLNAASLTSNEVNEEIMMEHPGVELHIDNIRSFDVIAGLRAGNYDYAICTSLLSRNSKEFRFDPFMTNRYLVITPRNIDLSKMVQIKTGHELPLVKLRDITDLELIVQDETCGMHWVIDEMYEMEGDIQYSSKMTVVSSLIAIESVANGLGSAIVSSGFATYIDKGKVNIYEIDTDYYTQVGIMFRKDRHMTNIEKYCLGKLCHYIQSRTEQAMHSLR